MLRRLASQHLTAVRVFQPQGKLIESSRSLSQYFTTGSGRDPSNDPSQDPRSSSWVDRQERHDKHWLDRVFPGSREWLESQNRKWWFTNVAAICRYLCKHACWNLELIVLDTLATSVVREKLLGRVDSG